MWMLAMWVRALMPGRVEPAWTAVVQAQAEQAARRREPLPADSMWMPEMWVRALMPGSVELAWVEVVQSQPEQAARWRESFPVGSMWKLAMWVRALMLGPVEPAWAEVVQAQPALRRSHAYSGHSICLRRVEPSPSAARRSQNDQPRSGSNRRSLPCRLAFQPWRRQSRRSRS